MIDAFVDFAPTLWTVGFGAHDVGVHRWGRQRCRSRASPCDFDVLGNAPGTMPERSNECYTAPSAAVTQTRPQ
jgi:hypothetical protein